jgi:DNA-binding transcriptional LysR family regulator
MDFRQLEAFVNVAKYKSFSKAGKALYLSQPTISLHIANLEKDLSVVLFDRTSKEVNLTPSGKEFLNYALDLINMKNKAVHQLNSSADAISGTINISASITPSLILLPRAIQTFQCEHPDVQFNVEEKNSTLILEDVCSLTSDIGIVGMKVENDRFISHHLFDDEIVFICSADSEIGDVICLEELSKYNLINRLPQSSTRIELERALVEQGHDISVLNTTLETDILNLNLYLVEKNAGITYLSKSVYESYRKYLHIKSFNVRGVKICRAIYMITNRRRTLSPAAEDFIRIVKTLTPTP